MFDIYVRGKSQFLVTRRGLALPADLASRWKKKRSVRHGSEEIVDLVARNGFYARLQMRRQLKRPRCQMSAGA
jgi:hypothetical protein